MGTQAEEDPVDRVYVTTLTRVDAVGMRIGNRTLVHITDRLSPSDQDWVAAGLVRALRAAPDHCASALLPRQRATYLS